ncbi:30 kDa heat shock protein [Aspergillus karnatakaensis]|uniref:Hsp20/alpha crystallin family protein n=1 Tax=Aspergillus karnatakaensis TaxID=1810916 RepID=UPI003CCD034E
MSLFQTFPFPSDDWSPLFTLLDDYDTHRSRNGQRRSKPTVRTFTPSFDVRESNDAYHLDGELPGIAQKDIDIQFTDPQTLVIKGRSERQYQYSSGTDDSATTENQQQDAQAQSQAGGSSTEVTESKAAEKQVSKNNNNKPRYWASERSIGEFQRTFTFPARVDQDGVRASLKDGILSLVVPKAAAPVSRKITIQ